MTKFATLNQTVTCDYRYDKNDLTKIQIFKFKMG